MKSNILDNTYTGKSPCADCEYVNYDKNECAESCIALQKYQQGQPHSDIDRYRKVEPVLTEEASDVFPEIIPEEEPEKQKQTPLTPFGITLKKEAGECLLCERKAVRRDLCLRCYQRWWNGLEVHPAEGVWTKMTKDKLNEARGFIFDQCLIPGCDSLGDRRGLCQKCYRKWQRGYIEHPIEKKFTPIRKKNKMKVVEKSLEKAEIDKSNKILTQR